MPMNPTVKEFLTKLGIEIGCVVAAIVGKRVIEEADKKLETVREKRQTEKQLQEHN